MAALVLVGCGAVPPEAPGGPPSNHLWSRSLGQGRIEAVTIDQEGSVLVDGSDAEGSSRSDAPALSAVLVIKLDRHGQEIWSKRFGGMGFDRAVALTTDSVANVFIGGSFTSRIVDFEGEPVPNQIGRDTFLVKLSPSGRHIWSKSLAARSEGLGLATDATAHLLIFGAFTGAVDFGAGPDRVIERRTVLAKLAPSGMPVWVRNFRGSAPAYAAGLTADSAGHLLATGSFDGTLDFGGGTLRSAGGSSTFVVKLDASGRHLWSRSLGLGRGLGIATDGIGQVLIAGDVGPGGDLGTGTAISRSDRDAFVLKLGVDGQTLWAKTFGDEHDQRAEQVAVDRAGNVLVTGEFQGAIDMGGQMLSNGPGDVSGLEDIFLAKLDSGGFHLWSHRFGDAADNQGGTSLAVDPNAGDILVGGWFGSTVDFGGGPLFSDGQVKPTAPWGSDHAAFVARFGP